MATQSGLLAPVSDIRHRRQAAVAALLKGLHNGWVRLILLGAIGVGKRTTVEAIAATSAQEQRAHAILRKPGKGEPAVEADVWW